MLEDHVPRNMSAEAPLQAGLTLCSAEFGSLRFSTAGWHCTQMVGGEHQDSLYPIYKCLSVGMRPALTHYLEHRCGAAVLTESFSLCSQLQAILARDASS